MTRLVWSKQAEADLAAIRTYIARDSERYAQITVDRLVASVDRLLRWPRSGRVVPEIGDENLRELLMPPYRVVYRVYGDVVGVATVIHSSRAFHLPSEGGPTG